MTGRFGIACKREANDTRCLEVGLSTNSGTKGFLVLVARSWAQGDYHGLLGQNHDALAVTGILLKSIAACLVCQFLTSKSCVSLGSRS